MKPSVLAQICDPSTWKVEAVGSGSRPRALATFWVQSQPGLWETVPETLFSVHPQAHVSVWMGYGTLRRWNLVGGSRSLKAGFICYSLAQASSEPLPASWPLKLEQTASFSYHHDVSTMTSSQITRQTQPSFLRGFLPGIWSNGQRRFWVWQHLWLTVLLTFGS